MVDVVAQRALDAAFSISDTNDIQWSDVVDALRVLMRADAANFSAFDLRAGQLSAFVAQNHDDSADDRYREHFHQFDPVTRSGLAVETGTWVSTSLFPLRERWRSTEFYADFLRPLGIQQVSGIVISRDSTSMAGFGFQSTLENRAFGDHVMTAEVQLVTRVLVSAYSQRTLQARLAYERALAILNPEREATLVLGADARLTRNDDVVPPWLASGSYWHVQGGRLFHSDTRENSRFRQFISTALEAGGSLNISLKGSWGELFMLRAVRREAVIGVPEPRSLAVHIERRDIFSAPSEESLRGVFDLTVAEARLLRLLMQGHDLATCADILSVTKNTTRKQLSSIMRKTGCNRQSELARLASLL